MSVTGYLGARVDGLRMPKGPEAERFGADGAVLEGRRSVELERAMEAARVAAGASRGPGRPATWARVEDYDPVLRSHCRLTEP